MRQMEENEDISGQIDQRRQLEAENKNPGKEKINNKKNLKIKIQ